MTRGRKISIIGTGKMGSCIATGLLKNAVFRQKDILVTGKNRQNLDRLQGLGATLMQCNAEAAADSDIVLLAVKPKDMEGVCNEISPVINGQLFISIAAGVSISKISDYLKSGRLVRAMPNIGAFVGQGFTALATTCAEVDKKLAQVIFSSMGRCVFVDERQMDMMTAITGSGPAFIFRLASVLEQLALAEGLDRYTARLAVAQMILGAGKVLRTNSAKIDDLVGFVASPGGTTEAGLHKAAELHLEDIFGQVVRRAAERSLELGK